MSVLTKLACMQDRRDEGPNKDLARALVEGRDAAGIREIAASLGHEDRRIGGDCASVLEQIGLLDPGLIEDYVPDLLGLLSSKNNRLVWGAMIVLATVADRRPHEVFDALDTVVAAMTAGSVITRDNGIKTLAAVASAGEAYNRAVFPLLIAHLEECRAKSVPQYAESIRRAVTPANQARYLEVLDRRFDELSPAQQRRVRKLLRTFEDEE